LATQLAESLKGKLLAQRFTRQLAFRATGALCQARKFPIELVVEANCQGTHGMFSDYTM